MVFCGHYTSSGCAADKKAGGEQALQVVRDAADRKTIDPMPMNPQYNGAINNQVIGSVTLGILHLQAANADALNARARATLRASA